MEESKEKITNMEKKYPIVDMILPAEKVAFIQGAIEMLRKSNRSDYESGEFDSFNHKQEGRYTAFEEVLQLLTPIQPPAEAERGEGAVWVKALKDLPLHKAFWNMPGEHLNNECYFPVRIDGFKYRVGEIFDNRQEGAPAPIYYFVIDGVDYFEKDFHRIEWLNESGEKEVPNG